MAKRAKPGQFLTTHTGSLPRPDDLAEMILAHDRGESVDQDVLQARIRTATAEVVRKQAECGIDVLSDGEYSKPQYTSYIKARLTGFEGPPMLQSKHTLEQQLFPDFHRTSGVANVHVPSNDGPVSLKDPSAVRRDIATFQAALADVDYVDAFMTAPSPGQITRFMPTSYYPSDREYLEALAEAMRDEYHAIVDAGFLLQLDCPDLASGRTGQWSHLSLDEFRDLARLHVEVLNHAVDGLPAERLRLHLCWGNYEGPHIEDVPLRDILDVVLTANVGHISFEAANPRHAHEWNVFEDVALPADKKIMPGVIDSCTNYVEHPDLVAERLVRYANLVGGPERVLGGSDCGFGTSVGPRRVAPSIVWAKLTAMADGARLASKRLAAVAQ